MNKQKSGFSLIELLVVIVIMGILATISIGTFQRFFGQARDAKVTSEVKGIYQVVLAAQSSEWAANKYTATNEVLQKLLEENGIDLDENTDLCYVYGYAKNAAGSQDNEFFVAGWSEDTETVIVDGTATAKNAVEALDSLSASDFDCDGAGKFTGYTPIAIDPSEAGECSAENEGFCRAGGCSWDESTCSPS